MTDILFRAELHTPEQARAILARQALPWVGEQLKQGRELVAEFRLLDDDITDKQRAYLHAVVLAEIALLVDGRPQLAEAVTAALFSTDPDVAGVRERIGREFVERIDAALAEDSTPARVETLNLILIGALVRAGTGHGTYANVASRLERAAALVMGGKSA